MEYLKKIVLGIFVFHCRFFAKILKFEKYSLAIAIILVTSKTFAIEINDIILVHVTDVKPSISEDGKSLILKTGGSIVTNVNYPDGKIFYDARDFSKPSRATLHWSLNAVTRSAGLLTQNGKFFNGIPVRYVILEPISSLKDSLWGERLMIYILLEITRSPKKQFLLFQKMIQICFPRLVLFQR